MQVLAVAGGALLEVAQAVGLEGDRQSLVAAYGQLFAGAGLAPLAALLHHLSPGIRLM
jgi:hypothetical protein